MPLQWNDSSQFQLFLTILETHDVKVNNWEKISEKMHSKGFDASKEACRQQFQKLKKKTINSAPNTPGGPPSTGGKRKRTKNVDGDGDDDPEFPQTPSKSAKREKKPKKENKKEEIELLESFDQPDAQVFKVEDDETLGFDLEDDSFY